jgi:HSP20 family protein
MFYVNQQNQAAIEKLLKPQSWAPATDVYETDEGVLVWIDLPGVSKESLKVETADGVLHIQGIKAVYEKSSQAILKERHSGEFERKFRISKDLDESSIVANFEEGILKLNIRKKEELKPRSIHVL